MIKLWQQKVDEWIHNYGVRYFDIKTNMLLLTEEVGELSRLIARQFGEQSFKHPVTEIEVKGQIEDEIADIFFVLTCISNQLDIDLEEVLEKNLRKKTNRDATRHQDNAKLK